MAEEQNTPQRLEVKKPPFLSPKSTGSGSYNKFFLVLDMFRLKLLKSISLQGDLKFEEPHPI